MSKSVLASSTIVKNNITFSAVAQLWWDLQLEAFSRAGPDQALLPTRDDSVLAKLEADRLAFAAGVELLTTFLEGASVVDKHL